MSVLVIVEHEAGQSLTPTRHAIAAARAFEEPIDLFVAGENCGDAAMAAAQLPGIRRVWLADSAVLAHALPEPLAFVVAEKAIHYSAVIAAATSFAKNFLPRVAALLEVAMVSDVVAIESAQQFTRPIYAGSLLASVRTQASIKVLSIRPAAFEAVPLTGGSASIETVAVCLSWQASKWISKTTLYSDRPTLADATVVVAGGRGLGSAETFTRLLFPLADTLGAAVGATRAAVDAGYAPNDWQVGQTGRIVAPQLYIAVGISGAIQHLAGMKNSQVIVALNQDASAPIFEVADYGMVGDLFVLVPELTRALKADAVACKALEKRLRRASLEGSLSP